MTTHFPGTPQERIALDIYIKLSRAANAVTHRINRHLAEFRLTTSQFGVLEALFHLGPMNQKQLGQKILKSGGNMTMVIENLCRRGLVKRRRDQPDRRFVTISLTEDGRQLISQIFPKHVSITVQEIGVLTADEQAALAPLLRKLGLGR